MLSLIALCTPALAHADDTGPVPEVAATAVGPSADVWLRIGLERYERGNLVGAIDAFEKGYQREARPMFLFALGQAHRKRGDCDRARAMYDAFIATSPPQSQLDAAVEQREACAPPRAAAEPAPAPAAAPLPPKVLVIEHETRTKPWHRDRIALASGGATIALAGSGIALWLAAERAADGAAGAETYSRHVQLRERAESRQLAAGITFGAAAVTTAITVWRITRDRSERVTRERERGAVLAPVVGTDSVGVTLGGRF